MAPKKSRSNEAANGGSEEKRDRKPKPDFSMQARDVEVHIAEPTVENVKRTLGYVSGEAAAKQVKPEHYITGADIEDDGSLSLYFGIGKSGAETVEETA